MINLTFPDCLIISCDTRTSKSGNPFVVLSFFSQSAMDKFEVLCFDTDSIAICSALKRGDVVSLDFEVLPNQGSAGIRVRLVGLGGSR